MLDLIVREQALKDTAARPTRMVALSLWEEVPVKTRRTARERRMVVRDLSTRARMVGGRQRTGPSGNSGRKIKGEVRTIMLRGEKIVTDTARAQHLRSDARRALRAPHRSRTALRCRSLVLLPSEQGPNDSRWRNGRRGSNQGS